MGLFSRSSTISKQRNTNPFSSIRRRPKAALQKAVIETLESRQFLSIANVALFDNVFDTGSLAPTVPDTSSAWWSPSVVTRYTNSENGYIGTATRVDTITGHALNGASIPSGIYTLTFHLMIINNFNDDAPAPNVNVNGISGTGGSTTSDFTDIKAVYSLDKIADEDLDHAYHDDGIYAYSVSFHHTAGPLTINITMSDMSMRGGEKFGIDNIFMSPRTSCPTCPKPIDYATGITSDTSAGVTSEYGTLSSASSPGLNIEQRHSDSSFGNNVFADNAPYLVADGKKIILAMDTYSTLRTFTQVGTTNAYTAGLGSTYTLVRDATNHQYVITGNDGSIARYADFDSTANSGLEGKIASITDSTGDITYAYNSTSHKMESATHVRILGDYTTKENFSYSYNSGKVSSVAYQTKKWDTTSEDPEPAYTTKKTTSYSYYGSDSDFGEEGDLESVTVKAGSGDDCDAVLDRTYYRYYMSDAEAPGAPGALKYVLNSDSYNKFKSWLDTNDPGNTPEEADDSDLEDFADKHFEYDSDGLVTKDGVTGNGSNEITHSSFGTAGYNTWVSKSVESLPDGGENVTYFNNVGRVMLYVTIDALGNKRGTYTRFDSQGRTELVVDSSALELPSNLSTLESNPDLIAYSTSSGYSSYIADNSGLLTFTEYDGNGNVQYIKVKRGDHDSAATLESMTYTSHTYSGGSTVYNLASHTQYMDASGSVYRTTNYTYTYFTDTNLIESMTTTLPGDATIIVWHNSLGMPVWTKDSGVITYKEYDPLTGEITKTIEDVDTDEDAEFENLPSGWENTSGRNLITTRTITESSSTEFKFNTWARKITESLPDGSQQIRYLNIEDRVMLSVTVDALGRMWGNFSKFDSQGRTILEAEPSALILPSSLSTLESNDDLMDFGSGTNSGYSPYIADTSGLLRLTVYDANGNLEKTKIQRGDHGTPITVEAMTYTSHTYTGGNTVYNLATYTQYSDTAESVARITSYSYTYFSDTNLVKLMTTTLPTVGISQNGPGTSGSITVAFDARGNAVWTRDASGMISYNEYNALTGELNKTIVDVKYSSLSAEQQAIFPSGWTHTSGFNLVTTSVTSPFGFGSTTQTTDPKGNTTYRVSNDANNEVRTYSGWHAVGGGDYGPTGPVVVSRQDSTGDYSETLSFAYTPSTVSAPTGTESISNIQSLSRTHTNTLGQVDESNDYFNLSEIAYSASFHLGSLSINYVAQTFGYSAIGQQNRSVSPNGTITRIVFDALGRPVSMWIGTNDTDATDDDPTGGAASGNNMVKISENVYDNGGVGDGNLTETKTFPTGNASPRSTKLLYNWRNQLISTKSGLVYGLPSGWTDSDIGSPSVAGSATFDGTMWTLNAAGSDIGGTSDQFNFVSRSLTGNTTMIVRVDNLVNTDADAKVGLMLRDSSAVGAKDAFVYVTPSGTVGFEYRTSTNGSASVATESGASGAIYLKLTRTGNSLSAAYSTDGTSWSDIGTSQTVSMNSALLAGIAATSHNTSSATTATLDLLSIGGTAVTTESGVHRPLTVNLLNNVYEATATFGFDGDGISMVDNNVDGIPDALFGEIYPDGDDDPPAGYGDTVAGLVSYSTMAFDDQGRAFRNAVYSVDPSSHEISSDAVVSNTWFDHRGSVIKSATSGGATNKFVYDNVGRLSISYVTDGGSDLAAGTSSGTNNSWTSALNVTGDKVLEQREYTYDANSNVVLTTLRQRFDDATDTGALGNPSSSSGTAKARISYTLSYFDTANRLTARVDVGTNGSTMSAAAGGVDLATDSSPANGIPDVLEGSVPSRSNTILVTTYEYCPAGWLDTVTDPRGVIAKTFFDAMGRTTFSVAAWDEVFDPTEGDKPSASNENQTVAYTYDASGHIKTLTAVTAEGTNSQTTVYTYGVSPATGSTVASNDILSAVTYGSQYFAGTSGNDDFVVQLEDGDSDILEVWKIVGTESELLASLNYAGIGSLVFDGGAGDDNVTLDLTYGSFELPGVFLISSGTSTLMVDNSSTNSSNTATINSDLATLNDHLDVVVEANARLTFNASQRLQSITLAAGSKLTVGTASWARQLGIVTEGLSIATNTSSVPTATIDLRDNTMVVTYGITNPAAALEDMVGFGRNGGTWDGFGITSSISAGNPTYGIGIIDNGNRPFGGPYTIFDGIVVPANAVLIKSTYAGDFTLNGSYDSNDAVLFANSYNDGSPARFDIGDINYDAIFSSNDAIAFATYYNASLPSLALKYSTATAPNQERFRYNGTSEMIGAVDRNGTVHTFTLDSLSRLTADAATIAPGNHYAVDSAILRIETTFNNQGMAEFITSYDAALGGNAVNQIKRVYNGLGQLAAEFQSHDGVVDTASTPSVQYIYDDDLSNGSRLIKMIYPNGRILHYGYETGIDDDISRLSYLADDNGSGSAATPSLETYSYLGLSTVISRSRPETSVALTFIKQTGDSDYIDDGGDGRYTGIDRFGRVVDQLWYKGTSSYSSGNVTDRFQYGYDRNSNVLFKKNIVDENQSELYHANSSVTDDDNTAYDPLNRLIAFSRGELSDSAYNGGNLDTIDDPSREQSWDLDSLGNMNNVWTNGTGSARTHDDQNQIVQLAGGTGPQPQYDAAGNMTKDDHGQTLIYDAWNRLVRVNNSSSAFVVSYGIDGTGRRIVETDEQPSWLLSDINSGSSSSSPSNFIMLGSTLLFTATNSSNGTELWKTDGTTGNTELVKDINSGSGSSSPSNFVVMGGTLYFTADDGSNGRELWKTDGTTGGTTLVKDINTGTSSTSVGTFTIIGSTLYFSAFDDTNGSELWTSDGTTGGTAMVLDIRSGSSNSSPSGFIQMGSNVYFTANDGSHGIELWKTDGTSGGTSIVLDINSGTANASVGNIRVIGSSLLFTATDGTGGGGHGVELWKSDGTGGGTALVLDINNGTANASISNVNVIGSTLYFTATDGTGGGHGVELWKSDGTGGGTSLILDINSGTASSSISSINIVSSTLYFLATDGTGGGAHGAEFWKSDGTTGGTELVKDINAGTASASISSITLVGSTFYFAANDGTHGGELWKSDGTTGGTVLVKDVMQGSNSSFMSSLSVVDGAIYFTAWDQSGNELWTSDGTGFGTRRLTDLATSSNGTASVANITGVNGHVIFTATTSATGTELFTPPDDFGTTDLYYTAAWQVIEERAGETPTLASEQNVWSPVYVNALILRDADTTSGGNLGIASSGLDQRIYVQQDANYNVTAITNTSGVVQERYFYDPYGEVSVRNDDYTQKGTGLATASGFNWRIFFQGGKYDSPTGLYIFQRRNYSPTLMRWISQDPIRYAAGDMNLYGFVGEKPVIRLDPSGLKTLSDSAKERVMQSILRKLEDDYGPKLQQQLVSGENSPLEDRAAYVVGHKIADAAVTDWLEGVGEWLQTMPKEIAEKLLGEGFSLVKESVDAVKDGVKNEIWDRFKQYCNDKVVLKAEKGNLTIVVTYKPSDDSFVGVAKGAVGKVSVPDAQPKGHKGTGVLISDQNPEDFVLLIKGKFIKPKDDKVGQSIDGDLSVKLIK